jgi:hypothetical protein
MTMMIPKTGQDGVGVEDLGGVDLQGAETRRTPTMMTS